MALNYCRHRIPHGATVVLIFHDRGERYLDTIYSESWVKEHFGPVSSLWHDEALRPARSSSKQINTATNNKTRPTANPDAPSLAQTRLQPTPKRKRNA